MYRCLFFFHFGAQNTASAEQVRVLMIRLLPGQPGHRVHVPAIEIHFLNHVRQPGLSQAAQTQRSLHFQHFVPFSKVQANSCEPTCSFLDIANKTTTSAASEFLPRG